MRILIALLILLVVVSCRRPPVSVGVVFATSWKLGTETLNESDQSPIKRSVLETLRHAYSGFAVHFAEGVLRLG